jgi:Flp pilus assembly pilin Flp
MNRTRIGSGIVRLLEDEGGQDLIEYALLTGAITFGSVAFVLIMQLVMRSQYVLWQAGAQAAWEPCPPGGCP